MGNNKQHVTDKYVTGKGELVGFIALTKPSTKFNKEGVYTVNILLPKEEGEALYQKIKDIRTEQFKTYGKGTKVADITKCKPYTTVDEETGEEIADPAGRYVLTANSSAYIKDGKIGKRIQIINAKKKPVKNISIGEGTIARLGVVLSGYSVAGKTGVSVKLGLVQIIELVEYSGSAFSLDAFDEEDGFDGLGEEFTDDAPTTPENNNEVPFDEDDDEEADF